MDKESSNPHEKETEESPGLDHGGAGQAERAAKPLESLGLFALRDIYGKGDLVNIQDWSTLPDPYTQSLGALGELLERDKLREQDGFPRKIRVGKLVKPGRGDKGKIILVPTTVEEKFIHDVRNEDAEGGGESGGSGEGEEGEVIGEEQAEGGEGSGKGGAGQGEGAER